MNINIFRRVVLVGNLCLCAAGISLYFPAETRPQQADLPCVTHVESLVYEPFARMTAIAGDVKLQVDVDELGNVSAEHVVSGHPLLLQEAEKNIKLWRFKPGHTATLSVTYEFRLVEPRTDKDPYPTISYDLPFRVRVTSKLPPVYP
jgi:hypothetical protein